MRGFVQTIEFTTSRIDEVRKMAESSQADQAAGTAIRALFTEDRDHPGHFTTIVEFSSYDEAMKNSQRPETSAFAKQLAELCDSPPVFHNLDVQDLWVHPSRMPLGHESGLAGLSPDLATAEAGHKTPHEPGLAGES